MTFIVRSAVSASALALALSAFSFHAMAQDASDLRALSTTVLPGKHDRAAPACPSGKKFLLTHVQASPVVGKPPSPDIVAFKARWIVQIFVQNPDDGNPSTTPDGALLLAGATGVTEAETSIPSGQLLAPQESNLLFSIAVLDPMIASSTEPGPHFNVNFSGFCGVRG